MRLLITFLLVFTISLMSAQAGWELVKQKDDITVYVRKQAGSATKEVKIDGKITCTLSEIVKALEDVESQSEWVESTKEVRILKNNGPGSFDFYQGIDMPYPVSDRDVAIRYKRTQDPSSKVVSIDFKSIDGVVPTNDDYVRIAESHSTYTLTPTNNGTIAVQYFLKIDVGGKMPKWVVNMAITKGPIDTMEALFAAIKNGNYSSAVVEGISEL